MSRTIIFDTEATGLDSPELIEAAWLLFHPVVDLAGNSDTIPDLTDSFGITKQDEEFEQRYKPVSPITFGAMAVHHILPSELEGCPPSDAFELPEDIDYMVGHNIDFDWRVAGEPDIKRICTDAMSRYVWTDADSYSQSALLYMNRGANKQTRQELKGAHSALADVMNNARLLECILAQKPEIGTWSELYKFSELCRIPRVLSFGKCKGVLLRDLPHVDYGYCNWLLNQDWVDEYLRRGLNMAIRGELPEEE